MSAVSFLEDIEDRAIDDATARGALPVTAAWFAERRKRHLEQTATQVKLKAQKAKAAAESEAARLEKRTHDYVEGQLLWLQEAKDVRPLRRER